MTRKNEISVLNVLFCLLVIFIHCSGSAVVLLPYNNISRTVLYTLWKLSSFVVQGFIFLSGMKHFMKQSSKPYPMFMWDKIKKIFLPYVLWCVVYYLYYVALGTQFNFSTLIKGIFIGDICGHFYYIVTIMQFYLLFPLWKKILRKDNIIIVLPVTLLISAVFQSGLPIIIKPVFSNFDFIYNDRIFTTYLVYWVLGCYAGLYYDEFKNIVTKSKAYICALFALCAFFAAYLPYMAEKHGYFLPFLGDLHMLYSISAILFTFMLALIVKDTPLLTNALTKAIDRSSYNIYLSHCLVLSAVDVFIINHFGIMPLDATAVRYITVYPITIAMCCIFAYIKKKYLSK